MDSITEQRVDRVRRHTSRPAAEEIDTSIRRNVRHYGSRSPSDVSRRIGELGREWDVERMLEANASALALTGAILGTTVNKKWFWLTGGVLTFLFQHATSGWCPPLPFLRRFGVRTQSEIDQEKYALKTIRGDFQGEAHSKPDVEKVLQAVGAEETPAGPDHHREPDRVRRYTSREQLDRIDTAMEKRVRLYASQSAGTISERIDELRREWSIERYLQINAAVVGLSTAALAATSNRKWGILTCARLAMFMFHAIEGFDPPLPALRRMGVRTRAEIDREIYALKILRGDFDDAFESGDETNRIEPAITAVGV